MDRENSRVLFVFTSLPRSQRCDLRLSLAHLSSTPCSSTIQGLYLFFSVLPLLSSFSLYLQICSLIVEHSFRVINSSFSLPLSSTAPTGRIDLDLHLEPLDSSFYLELIPWTLYACRYIPRQLLSEYLPHYLSFICRFIPDNISRTKLFSECTILLLVNVENDGCIAHPEVLFHTLGHPAVMSLFLLETGTGTVTGAGTVDHSSSSTAHCFRERFVTSLCRAIVKLVPVTLAYVLATDGTVKKNELSEEGDTFGDSLVPLTAAPVLSSSSSSCQNNRLPFQGVGCYAELCGTTIRSSCGGATREGSCSTSAELALQQLDNLVASALFVLRSSHK
jgi:hypothetical protein